MRPNLEIALTEQPKRGPRNRAEQRAIWRRKLREELEQETRDIDLLETAGLGLLKTLEAVQAGADYIDPALVASEFDYRDQCIGWLFSSMHRVAYFEGLLKDE